MHRQCQQGQGAWQEGGAGAGLCGAGGRKAKAQLELDVVRGAKPRRANPSVSNAGRLETTDEEKAASFMGNMGSAHSLCVSVHSIRLKNAVPHSESKARSIPCSCPSHSDRGIIS